MKPTFINTAFAISVLIATPWIAACAANSTQESTGEYFDDSAITAKIKSKLLEDKDVSGLQISVETYKGRVQLSGFVSSQEAKAKAEKLTRSVPGVKSVTNDLIVKTG